MVNKLEHVLRAYGEMAPQKNDTICVWGTDSRDTIQAFSDKRLRAFGYGLSSLEKSDHGLRFMFGFVVGELEWVLEDRVHVTLKRLRECHTEAIWFVLAKERCPNTAPAEYWGMQFAKVFPRFRMSNEKDNYVFQAFPDKRWTE